MNSGKICIPVCARTVDSLIQKVAAAEPLADVVEVRFDCVDHAQLAAQALSRMGGGGKPILATFRSPEQGGRSSSTREQRLEFWGNAEDRYWGVDLEEDILREVDQPNVIGSYHSFESIPPDLPDIYDRLSGAEIVKIAIAVADATDAIPLWHVLERARSSGKPLIPVAMGEAGKWTRILGLAHGAFLSYAALEDGKGTADGQISALDMVEVYRVKELTPATRVYGVIGDPVAQSKSPYMQNAAFQASGEDAVFMHLLVRDLDAFMRRMVLPTSREVELNFGGFSVTMPHKLAAMNYLDEVDATAISVGAVNTIKVVDGRLIGYNTDVTGFLKPLKQHFGSVRGAQAALFGAGGAARACAHALRAEGADVTVFARDTKKAQGLTRDVGVSVRSIESWSGGHDIVVNATPIGMKGPLVDQSVLTSTQLAGVRFVYDLVTSPTETCLIKAARAAGVQAIGGIEMLIAQGAEQFRIWTGKDAPVETMKRAVMERIDSEK